MKVVRVHGAAARGVIAAAAVLVALSATALGSPPRKGATYAGKVPEKAQESGRTQTVGRHEIKFTVSGNGKDVKTYKAFFTTNGCQLPRSGADTVTKASSIPIKNGSFGVKGSYTVNGFTDYVKLSGTFSHHGKLAAVIFHWRTNEPDCASFHATLEGSVHIH